MADAAEIKVGNFLGTGSAVMQRLEHYIGIDYSVAKTAYSSLQGLRIYPTETVGEPQEAQLPLNSRKY